MINRVKLIAFKLHMADQVLQDIKDRLNVNEVISGYIPIKKSGTNFKAVCPFHNEKSPSLMISPQKQIWHCFGCGEGGDVFGFVMRYENLDFKEALKLLADRAGVKLPQYQKADPREREEKEILLRINNFAARFYHEILINDKRGLAALEYLKNRSLTPATIKQWQIGFAPEDFHVLEQALATKKVSPEQLVKAGVSAKNERGQIYDRFRGRITFPIFDFFGEVVGFSARVLKDDANSAKYVNSPETVLYSKSKVLFGLNFAKNSIRKSDEAVIVEGQMDCIAAHQAGFDNVVASSGTALTLEQLALLGRLTKNLKFCFDADSAGQEAGRRAGELALRRGFRLKLIVLKNVKDPDELIKKSPGLWEKAVKEAVWFLDYHINLALTQAPEDPVAQMHYLTRQVMPLVGFIEDPLEQDHYVRQLTEKFRISERVVRQQIKPQTVTAVAQMPAQAKAPTFGLEKEVFGGMLMYTEYKSQVLKQAVLEDFESPEIRFLLEPLFSDSQSLDSHSTVAKEALFMVESQLDELQGNSVAHNRELLKSFGQLKLNSIKRQQQKLNIEIQKAEGAKSSEQLGQLKNKAAQLAAQRMQFEGLLSPIGGTAFGENPPTS